MRNERVLSSSSRSPRRRRFLVLVSALLVAITTLSFRSITWAQTGPEPGTNDPAGSPSTYQTLLSHDLTIETHETGEYPGGASFATFQVGEDNRFTSYTPITEGQGLYTFNLNSVSGSGHITNQSNEQVVVGARSVAWA